MRALVQIFGSIVLTVAALSTTACSEPSPPVLTEPKEIKLTEQIVKNFLAAQKEIMRLQQQGMEAAMKASEAEGAAATTQLDPKLLIAMETIAKKHGFAAAQDYADTGGTLAPLILPMMFNPDAKAPVDDSAQSRAEYDAEIVDVAKDATLDETQKASITAKLKASKDKVKGIAYPENYTVVLKFKDELMTQLKGTVAGVLGAAGNAKTP
jgi:hypothetical protein